MKYKESEEQPIVEVAIETQEEECPVEKEQKDLVKIYKKMIKEHLELIDSSLCTIRRMMDKLYECREDNDPRETSC